MTFTEYALTEAKGAKAFIGKIGKKSYAIKIDALSSNSFPEQNFGQQLGDLKIVKEWKTNAKKDVVGSKGKATLASVKAWVAETKPSEFYASWESDSSTYKDDSIEIWYKD